jgi:predicted dehydrogenase
MAEDLRVALIGYGLAGQAFHAPIIATTPGLRLTAIVTGDSDRGARAKQEHPGATIFRHPDDLWRARVADVVVVASPNRTHVPLAMQALSSGLSVVVDKPLAPTAAEARSLIGEARRRRLHLTVFQNRRWDGDFLTVRKLVGEGTLGEIYQFESRFERWRPTPRPGWRELGSPEEAGGLLYDLGSHLIDQAIVLFGPVDKIHAEIDRRRPGVQVDDDTFVSLTHASGVRSRLWMNVVSGQNGPRFRVLGSEAAFTKHGLDGQEDALRAGHRPGQPGEPWGVELPERWGCLGVGDHLRPVQTEPGAYPDFYSGLVSAIRDGAPLPVNPEDAIVVLELIATARALLRGARWADSDA